MYVYGDMLVNCRVREVIYNYNSTVITLDRKGSLELDIEPAQNVLNVMWRYKWPECRKYTVYLDNREVRDCIRISDMNCTIDQLAAGVEYKITVTATEMDAPTINATKLASTLHKGTGMWTYTLNCPVVYSLCLIWWLIHRYLQHSPWNVYLAATCCNPATTTTTCDSPCYLVLLRDLQSQSR